MFQGIRHPPKSSSPCAPRAKSFSCTCSCPPLAPPLPPKSGYPCAPPFSIRPHCPPPAPPLPSLPEASIRGHTYTPRLSMRPRLSAARPSRAPAGHAAILRSPIKPAAKTRPCGKTSGRPVRRPRLRCPPCGKPPSAGALAPFVFLCVRTVRARPSRARSRDVPPSPAHPYKAHRKKTYPRRETSRAPAEISPPFPMREPRGACFGVSAIPRKAALHAHRAPPFSIRPHCPPPAPPLPSLRKASIRGRAYTPRLFIRPRCPHPRLRCPLCRKPPSAGTLTPLDFLYGRAYPLHDSPAPSPAPL